MSVFSLIFICLSIHGSISSRQHDLQSLFRLEGSRTSYAGFPKWSACDNSSIEFEFETRRSTALLLYMDDRASSSFLELKIVRGSARLRYRHKANDKVQSLGDDLHGGKWHRVRVMSTRTSFGFSVDSITHSGGDSLSSDKTLPSTRSFSSVTYVGGLPESFKKSPWDLCLPSAAYEVHFHGSIRNFTMEQCGNGPERAELVSRSGIRGSVDDPCALHDPCQHGGLCISTDAGPICECDFSNYMDVHCTVEKTLSIVTLFGNGYIGYDLDDVWSPVLCSSDYYSFWFKTNQTDALLLYTGNGDDDYVSVGIHERALSVRVHLGSGVFETDFRPKHINIQFDDNQWHRVVLTRDSRELVAQRGICHVTIEVDDQVRKTGTVVGDFTMLSSTVMFLGGISKHVNLPGSRLPRFLQGCLKQAVYRADGLLLDLITMSRLNGSLVEVNGGHLYDKCEDMETLQPVTFASEESVLELPEWNIRQDGGGSTIEFTFQTNEADGLLLHSFMGDTSDGSHFLGVQMIKRYLYLVISGESKTKMLRLSSVVSDGEDRPLDDAIPHRVLLRIEGATTVIKVDDGSEVRHGFRLSRSLVPHQSDLNWRVYLGGGISSSAPASAGQRSQAPHVQAVQRGFVGCVQDLLLNADRVSLAALARRQEAEGVTPFCRMPLAPQCTNYPCLHGGVCTEGWNRFICDCRATGFRGPVCARETTVVRFDGTQYYWTSIGDLFHHLGFSISVRFRTSHSTCLLVALTSTISSDFVHLLLENGRLRFDMKSGADFKSLLGEHVVDDGAWHTALVDLYSTNVQLRSDNDNGTKADGLEMLHLDTLEVGLKSNRSSSRSPNKRGRNLGHDAALDAVMMADVEWDSRPPDRISFVGLMQQLVVNGKEFFDMTKTDETRDTEMTAVAERSERILSFASLPAYLITTVKIKPSFALYFRIKSTHPDGLIMYSGILGRDFFAVELSVGHLAYVYDVGFGARLLRVGLKLPVNDNRWHDVAILQVNASEMILRVDSVTKSHTLTAGFHFDTNIELYVGGVSQELYGLLPRQVRSRHGFQGCLSSIDFGAGVLDLLESGASNVPSEHKDHIKSSCRAAESECRPETCHNKGVCIEDWDSILCDCDLTSFTGPTCNEDSIAYSFGKNGGTIAVAFDESEQKDVKRDSVAFGLSTQQTDAVLLSLQSHNSKDFMEFELIYGSVFVTYNLGLGDQRVGDLRQKVDDHHYHIIRFIRLGSNATLQIDDQPTISYHPQGHQPSLFHSQARLRVGGSRNPSTDELHRPFKGMMAGLVVNSLRVLDLAAEGDHRVSIEGDIHLDVKPLKFHRSYSSTTSATVHLHMNSTESKVFDQHSKASRIKEANSDDLIFSGESSGCHYEDLDSNCIHNVTKSDVLFSPNAERSTTRADGSNSLKRTMLTSLMSDNSGETPCDSDNEECEISGDSGAKTTTTLVSSNLHRSLRPTSSAIDISEIVTKSTTLQQQQGNPVLQTASQAQVYESIKDKTEITSSVSWFRSYPSFISPRLSSPPQAPGTMPPSLDVLSRETSFVGIGSQDFNSLPMNIALIVSISVAVSVLLCMLAYILYKCHGATAHRDEAKVYADTSKTAAPNGKVQTINVPVKAKKKDVKEWYV